MKNALKIDKDGIIDCCNNRVIHAHNPKDDHDVVNF